MKTLLFERAIDIRLRRVGCLVSTHLFLIEELAARPRLHKCTGAELKSLVVHLHLEVLEIKALDVVLSLRAALTLWSLGHLRVSGLFVLL